MAGLRRIERAAELIQRELSSILQNEVRDLRLAFCTVAHVELTSDLRYAKVVVSTVSDEKEDILMALEKASGFLRRQVGARINLRYTPELRFRIDNTVDRLMEIDQMLASIRKSDP